MTQHKPQSRLDRLISLLSTGTTELSRKSAAEQIAELASSNSHSLLPNVLRKIRVALVSAKWETRVAGGRCMGEIARRVKCVRVRDLASSEAKVLREAGSVACVADERRARLRAVDFFEEVFENVSRRQERSEGDAMNTDDRDGDIVLDLKLENFDVANVLEKGIVLLSASQDQWSNVERGPGSKKERLERAKTAMKKTLGMELGKEAATFALDSKNLAEMVSEKDLLDDDDDDDENENDGGAGGKKNTKKRKKISSSTTTTTKSKEEGAAARLVDSLQVMGSKKKSDTTTNNTNDDNDGDDFDEEKLKARGMSARELNKLKRKNKRLRAAGKSVVKHQADDDDDDDDDDNNDNKKNNIGTSSNANEAQKKLEEEEERIRQEEDEEEAQEIEAGAWPFSRTCEFLAFSLFSSRWEDRHGAAVALREILRYQAESANIFFDASSLAGTKIPLGTTEAQMIANFSWLEDISVRLLCVLALDRFGDFVGDGVVAPVRETAAQALGMSLRDLPTHKVFDIGEATLTLLRHEKAWEVRHSGLIGLKYVFASIPQNETLKMEMLAKKLLPSALPRLIVALKDDDDDVRAAAAEAALPARDSLNPQQFSTEKSPSSLPDTTTSNSSITKTDFEVFLQTLWNSLLELDDLSPSARPIMSLLAKLCEKKETREIFDVASVANRLWPFASHPIASVREATWQTVSELAETLLENEAFVQTELETFMTLSLQGCALDEDDSASHAAKNAFLLALQHAPKENVALIFKSKGDSFLKILSVQQNRTCDAKFILVKKPAKMTGEARNVAADWLCRTKGRLSGIDCLAKALCKLVPESDGNSTISEALGFFLCKKLLDLSKHGAAVSRVAAFHICAKFLEETSNDSTNKASSSEFMSSFKEIYEKRTVEVLACANPAYPSAPSPFPYDEAKALQTYVKNETKALIRVCAQINIAFQGEIPSPDADGFGAVSAAQVIEIVPRTTNTNVERARSALDASASRLREAESKLHQSVLAAAAAAAVAFQELPEKLNPIIQPLMAATRRERDEDLQSEAAMAIARLVKRAMAREKSPSAKICSNIFIMACSCPETTPVATESGKTEIGVEEQKTATITTAVVKKSIAKKGVANDEIAAAADAVENEIPECTIAARGGAMALNEFCKEFKDDVFTQLPTLLTPIVDSLADVSENKVKLDVEKRQAISNTCRVVSIVAEACTKKAFEQNVHPLTPKIFAAATLPCDSVKKTASRALAAMTTAHPDDTLPEILALLAPALEGGDLEKQSTAEARRGAAFVALALTESVPDAVVAPYCVLLLVPLMSRMSDSNDEVRTAATKAFAALVPLLPLARGSNAPEKLSEAQRKRSESDGQFLDALLDNTKIDNFELPFKCKYSLRPYQRDGVNWLAFLRRFKLHGALCDDMGLGKTLQSTCILASSTVERRAKGLPLMPHLIICPPTLVGHWAHEISMYTEDPNLLSVLEYQGLPGERLAMQKGARTEFDVVVASYDSVRADSTFFHDVNWCYCVLDEGHAIRNPKSRVCLAVKSVKAEHRLLLSGTPIQNDVVELWSLFDFLMPGFLGTEREFKQNYGIAAARSKAAKKGGGLTEQGALTVGRLHKQVMPFVLRRTKDQVLKDLPPKIIQDVFVDLTPAQRRLYDNFETSGAKEDVSKALLSGDGSDGSAGGGAPHVFQALQYLRKLCSHPRLVDGSLKDKASKKAIENRNDGDKDNQNWSPKFEALKQILLDCGIGRDAYEEKTGDSATAAAGGEDKNSSHGGSSHRVLVFAQLKSLLDLVETELFGASMKGVSWLRLDGSVAASERFNVARKFNADPTIDVLLLTTHVGGLGLNLTTADTVVFLEHDWNPQKDLQAMDRAHRLGQKKTVNVYRILTKGTIEEKVMSLQRFKLDVANAVVNADNASMKSMDTGAMLDLFTAEKGKKAAKEKESAAAVTGEQPQNVKAVLNGLDELWAQSQYDEEFDVEQFQKSIAFAATAAVRK